MRARMLLDEPWLWHERRMSQKRRKNRTYLKVSWLSVGVLSLSLHLLSIELVLWSLSSRNIFTIFSFDFNERVGPIVLRLVHNYNSKILSELI
jgi:hypothetical protein